MHCKSGRQNVIKEINAYKKCTVNCLQKRNIKKGLELENRNQTVSEVISSAVALIFSFHVYYILKPMPFSMFHIFSVKHD